MNASAHPSPSVPLSLLERVRARDAPAWERLTRLFTPLVLDWVRCGGIPKADVPDVTQDVFLEVARSVARFRREHPGDTFTGWIRTITRRRVAGYVRTRRGETGPVGGSDARRQLEQVRDPLPDAPDAPDAPDEEADRAEVLRRGLELVRGDVAENTWAAFERVALNNRPPADVAAELGMTLGAVYVAKSRVLKRLREELDGIL